MSKCNVCGQPRSAFIMNNKTVCMRCDELLFDLEIECDEETPIGKEKPAPVKEAGKPVLQIVKK